MDRALLSTGSGFESSPQAAMASLRSGLGETVEAMKDSLALLGRTSRELSARFGNVNSMLEHLSKSINVVDRPDQSLLTHIDLPELSLDVRVFSALLVHSTLSTLSSLVLSFSLSLCSSRLRGRLWWTTRRV